MAKLLGEHRVNYYGVSGNKCPGMVAFYLHESELFSWTFVPENSKGSYQNYSSMGYETEEEARIACNKWLAPAE